MRMLTDDGENLGPPVAWHIRSIPEKIRNHYVDQAHAARCTLADLLTRLARETPSTTLSTTPSTASLAELTALLHAAAALAAAGVALPRELRRLISDLARGARPERQPQSAPTQIPKD